MKIIAGPCVWEGYSLACEVIDHMLPLCKSNNIEYYFKASFEKANRSLNTSFQGYPLPHVLCDFGSLKQKYHGLKIVTDVHTVEQARVVGKSPFVDVIQIPAFLSRQTELINTACSYKDKIVNIKKGQWMSAKDIGDVLTKTGEASVWITERGTCFGYNNLVVDFKGLQYMKETYQEQTIVFDGTHSTQLPGVGGEPEYSDGLMYAAAAVGIDSFFLEVHPNPEEALSDKSTVFPLDKTEEFISKLKEFVCVSA